MNQVLTPLRGRKIYQIGDKVAHVSGDSQYLNENFVRAIWGLGASFTIAAPRTILWHENTDKLEWSSYQYSDDELKKFHKKKHVHPPETHLALWNWWPRWGEERVVFPVVIKKEWREEPVLGQSSGYYHYHAVATNLNMLSTPKEQVIRLYKTRANIENAIKEFKLNFDVKNLPCLSKSTNEGYFLFVLMAQNLTRWAALIEQPEKPHYSKKLHRKLVEAPAFILTGSRQFTLKVKHKFF